MGETETVNGDDIWEVLDAIFAGETFEVCYTELVEGCYKVPLNNEILDISVLFILLELAFWTFWAVYLYRRKRRTKNKQP